ncbi:hypothetical protein NSPZN2_70101 [Nitrospira defluvii]|uniref:Uncharacterized protein n=1 Tax=Nitrospira defluvii TaxID=330214 RepID=A0ABM8S963_9BACT|nr:hypothetical protein NSPZN2_70101 [Nitrospira defluvii]
MRCVGPVMGKPHSLLTYRDAVKSKKEAVAGSVGAGFIHQLGPSNDGAYETVRSIHRPRLLSWSRMSSSLARYSLSVKVLH